MTDNALQEMIDNHESCRVLNDANGNFIMKLRPNAIIEGLQDKLAPEDLSLAAKIANLQNTLLEKGLSDKGIIAAETFDFDIIDKIYTPYDNLTLLVSLNADGSTKNSVVASIAEGVKGNLSDEASAARLREIFENPSLQMISFTITEKGYALTNASGEVFPFVAKDFENGPKSPSHAMSVVTSLLYTRYQKGQYPLAVVSMDNCSHNGEKVELAVKRIAKEWLDRGYVDAGFVAYVSDESKISFPWSMIDKITPRPS